MAKKRDYKAEYKRRIANGKKRGLSRSQARGHPKPGEKPIRPKKIESDERLETALRLLRQTGRQNEAAKRAGVSVERLRRFTRQNELAEWDGQSWTITDGRARYMTVITQDGVKELKLRDFDAASLNGKHLNAVKAFLNSNDISILEPFVGSTVTDASGSAHILETDPNELHRIAAAGGEVFHEVYKLTI